jgi:hypothetical protein
MGSRPQLRASTVYKSSFITSNLSARAVTGQRLRQPCGVSLAKHMPAANRDASPWRYPRQRSRRGLRITPLVLLYVADDLSRAAVLQYERGNLTRFLCGAGRKASEYFRPLSAARLCNISGLHKAQVVSERPVQHSATRRFLFRKSVCLAFPERGQASHGKSIALVGIRG